MIVYTRISDDLVLAVLNYSKEDKLKDDFFEKEKEKILPDYDPTAVKWYRRSDILMRPGGVYDGTVYTPPEQTRYHLKLVSDFESIEADGNSMATFTVSKVDHNGNPIGAGNETILVEPSSPIALGALSVQLSSGQATFVVTSQKDLRGTVALIVRDESGVLYPTSKKLTFE
jgi:hypothetical protein